MAVHWCFIGYPITVLLIDLVLVTVPWVIFALFDQVVCWQPWLFFAAAVAGMVLCVHQIIYHWVRYYRWAIMTQHEYKYRERIVCLISCGIIIINILCNGLVDTTAARNSSESSKRLFNACFIWQTMVAFWTISRGSFETSMMAITACCSVVLAVVFSPVIYLFSHCCGLQLSVDWLATLAANMMDQFQSTRSWHPRWAESVQQPTLTHIELAELNTNNKCTVCLQLYTSADAIYKTPCAHYFHAHCLTIWCQHSNTCPMCRQALYRPGPAGFENNV
jgi:hypothetical protein